MTKMFINPTAYLSRDLEDNPEVCVVIEYQRYTEPTEGWVFYRLVPDESGSEVPFLRSNGEFEEDFREYQKHCYRGGLDGVMGPELAENYRTNMEALGFTTVAWDDLPENFRGYIIGNVLPLEWQSDPEFCEGQTKIHVLGTMPTA